MSKGTFTGGMIRIPDSPLDLLATFTKGFLGPIPDCEKGMEKAQDHRDLMEQGQPRILRSWPAIGIDGFGGIIAIHSLGCAGQDTIGVLSGALRG